MKKISLAVAAVACACACAAFPAVAFAETITYDDGYFHYAYDSDSLSLEMTLNDGISNFALGWTESSEYYPRVVLADSNIDFMSAKTIELHGAGLSRLAAASLSGTRYGSPAVAKIDLSDTGISTIDASAFAYDSYLETLVLPSSTGKDFVLDSGAVNRGTPNVIWTSTSNKLYLTSASYANMTVNGERLSAYNYLGHCTLSEDQSTLTVSEPTNVVMQSQYGNTIAAGYPNVSKVKLRDGIEFIPSSEFSGMASLSTVNIPSSVRYIGSAAFENCTSLKSIDLSACTKMTCIGTEAGNATAVDNGPGAMPFQGCSSLETIVFPSSLAKVGGYALNQCGVKVVDLSGTAVTEICDGAFQSCTSLERIALPKTIKAFSATHYAVNTSAIVEVPCSAKDVVPANWSNGNDNPEVKVDLSHEVKIDAEGNASCKACGVELVTKAAAESAASDAAAAAAEEAVKGMVPEADAKAAADKAAADAKAEVEAKYQGYVSAEASAKAASDAAAKAAEEAVKGMVTEADAKAAADKAADAATQKAAQAAAASKQSLATYKAYKAAKSGKYKGKLKAAKSFYVLKGAKVTKVSGSKKLSVTKAGKVVVRKGTKKGIYTAKVKVKTAQGTQTVTVTVRVR